MRLWSVVSSHSLRPPPSGVGISCLRLRALWKRAVVEAKRRSSERSGTQGQRADIGGEFEDLRVVDLALERRHDRVVTAGGLGLRIENPVAQIDVVNKRELAVGERNLSAVKAAQSRARERGRPARGIPRSRGS